MEDKVGDYEIGRLICCPHCGQDQFSIYQMLPPGEHWRLFVPVQEPWKCNNCHGESLEPSAYHAYRFSCPKCSTSNVSVREPSKVEITETGDRISIHEPSTVQCFNCESVFDASVMNELRQRWSLA